MGGRKLEINLLPQKIYAKSKGELIIEGRVMLSEYGTCLHEVNLRSHCATRSFSLYLTALEQLAAMFISWC